jgi:hypothetical protein
MLDNVRMSLFIGPAVPIPAPKAVLDAVRSVSVTTGVEGPSGFQLVFDLSTHSPLHTLFLLAGGASPLPILRVVIAIAMGSANEVLIDGVVTNQEVTSGEAPGRAILTVTGEDLSRVMDYIDFSGFPFPAMPDFARVALILAKYAVLGVIPKVIPSVLVDVPIPTEKIPGQQGKDLAYIRFLANRAGYVFYMEPGDAVGTSYAYWGPQIKVGQPQPALNLDMDAHTNVEELSFNYNADAGLLPLVMIQNPQTKAPIPIPIPAITPLSPPLGLIPPFPKRFEIISETAKYSPLQGALVGLAKAAQATADAATATGTLDVRRYGRLLKARKLVGVRGAGAAFDGLWYVSSVTSTLSRGALKQSFKLGRNGLLSTVGRVAA